jgi:resuscitation-promoting factor RpfB
MKTRTAAAVAFAASVVIVGIRADHTSHHPHAGTTASSSSSVELGRRFAARDYDWRGVQFNCLDWLWTRESDWNADAVETASIDGQPPTYAYGIPQANPATWGHPFSLGDAPAQIRWGLKYIARHYGTPCAAWDHEQAHGWY